MQLALLAKAYVILTSEALPMNIKLSAVSDKNMDLTCSACGHEFSYKIADLMLTTSDDTTTHEVRQRAVCRSCGVREME
jgi:rubredoxin